MPALGTVVFDTQDQYSAPSRTHVHLVLFNLG